MCDIDGDIETKIGLLVDCHVTLSQTGQVNQNTGEADKTKQIEVRGVYSLIGCQVIDVLDMLGHDRSVWANYVLNKNYIPLEEDLVKEFHNIGPRQAGVCLVKEGDHLVGVLIDQNNQASILGVVSTVVPHYEHEMEVQNVVIVKQNGKVHLTKSKSIDMDSLLETGAKVGIVSVNGFLLVKTSPVRDDLVLILQHGYLVLENSDVVWIRKGEPSNNSNQTEDNENHENKVVCKQSQVGNDEIFVSDMGAIVAGKKEDDEDESHDQEGNTSRMWCLIGRQNAIMNYRAFKQCVAFYDSAQMARGRLQPK